MTAWWWTTLSAGQPPSSFYAEPTRTYDLDVFVTLHGEHGGELVSLSSVYEWARGRGTPCANNL